MSEMQRYREESERRWFHEFTGESRTEVIEAEVLAGQMLQLSSVDSEGGKP